MSQAFVKDSLFRPFQSTKKKGLGIGLFQSRAIVQAHGGGMHVESEVGKGTTFLASFPVARRAMTKTDAADRGRRRGHPHADEVGARGGLRGA